MANDREQEIRERAFRIWQDEGQPKGKDKEHWERARLEIEEEAGMTECHHNLKGQ